MRRIVINVNRDLPARPRKLTPAALSQVFGGCWPKGQWCSPYQNACCNECVKDGKAGALCS
jgi:hypothetical protein